MEEKIHTRKDAEYCLWYIKKYVCKDAKLIGGFGKGAEQSKKDIDIFLPNFFPQGVCKEMRAAKLRSRISFLLDAERVETTDWGGWFYHNTIFGNVDIFFNIDDLDY